jgi:hypothetical protein
MAKRVVLSPSWLRVKHVVDIYSVSSCVNDDFADYIKFWKHNGYWFFNSAADLSEVADAEGIVLSETHLFYYEVHPEEFDGGTWVGFSPSASVLTDVAAPESARLEGFDVVTFSRRTNAECSPLSCNSMAEEIPVNSHCLFSTFEEAWEAVNRGAFHDSEPGPYRIFSVYSADWP